MPGRSSPPRAAVMIPSFSYSASLRSDGSRVPGKNVMTLADRSGSGWVQSRIPAVTADQHTLTHLVHGPRLNNFQVLGSLGQLLRSWIFLKQCWRHSIDPFIRTLSGQNSGDKQLEWCSVLKFNNRLGHRPLEGRDDSTRPRFCIRIHLRSHFHGSGGC